MRKASIMQTRRNEVRWIAFLLIMGFGVFLIVNGAREIRSPVRIEPQVGAFYPSDVRFSPTQPGQFLLNEELSTISLWEFTPGQGPIRRLTLPVSARSADFSPNGKRIITAGIDGRLHWWTLAGTYEAASKQGHTAAISDISVASTGDVASTSVLGDVRVSRQDGSLRSEMLPAPKGWLYDLSFSADGHVLAGVGLGGSRLWHLEAGAGYRIPSGYELHKIAVAPRGDLVAIPGGKPGGISLVDSLGARVRPPLDTLGGPLSAVDFAPAGDHFASLSEAGVLRFWQRDGSERTSPLLAHPAGGITLDFAPDSRGLATVGWDAVRLWGLTASFRGELRGSAGRRSLKHAFSPDGSTIAVAERNTVTFWDRDGNNKGEPVEADTGLIIDLAFAADGTLASLAVDGTLRQRRSDGTGPIWMGRWDDVEAISFTSAGVLLAAGGDSTRLRIWRIVGGDRVEVLSTPVDRPDVLAVAGSAFAVADGEGVLRVYANGRSTSSAVSVSGGRDNIASVAVSADGQRLAVGHWNGDLELWDLVRSRRTMKRGAHPMVLRFLVFAPDGQTVISAGDEGTLRFWSLRAEMVGQPVRVHSRYIDAVAVSPRGDLLLTSSEDLRMRLWDLNATTVAPSITAFHDWDTEYAFPTSAGNFLHSSGVATVDVRRTDGSLVRRIPLPLRKDAFSKQPVLGISPDGAVAGVGGEDGIVQLWSTRNSSVSTRIVHPEGGVEYVKFLSTGTIVTAGGGRVRFWNLAGREVLPPLEVDSSEVMLAVAANGGIVAELKSWRGTVRIHEPKSRKVWSWVAAEKRDESYQLLATDLGVSRDGRLVATGHPGIVRVWRPDGTRISELQVGRAGFPVHTAARLEFSADRDLLITSCDGVVRLWDTRTLAEVAPARDLEPARMGFTGRSIFFIMGLHNVRVADLRLKDRGRYVFADSGALAVTATGLFSGTGSVAEMVRLYRMDGSSVPSSEAAEWQHPDEVRRALEGRRWSMRSLGSSLSRGAARLVAGVRGMSWWEKGGLLSSLAFAGVVLLVLVDRARPAQWVMSSSLLFPPNSVLQKARDLVLYFGRTTYCLDGWLQKFGTKMYLRAVSSEAVQERLTAYVDIGNDADVQDFLAAVDRNDAAYLWITGPGGSGKSTLALQTLARLAPDTSANTSRPVLPVLIDSDWDGSLLEHVAGKLWAESAKSKVRHHPTVDQVTVLARTGRLVLVLDGLSERRAADAVIELRRAAALFRHVVVTSRDAAPDGEFRQVEVGSLAGPALRRFVAKHAPGFDTDQVIQELATVGSGVSLRPLLARMAIQRLVSGDRLPDSIHGMIWEYVRGIRPSGRDRIREDHYLTLATFVAFHSVLPGFVPRETSRETLMHTWGLEGGAIQISREDGAALSVESALDQMVSCGLLSDSVSVIPRVRFREDPIAEALAARHLYLRRKKLTAIMTAVAPSSSFGEALRLATESLGDDAVDDVSIQSVSTETATLRPLA